MGYGFLCGLWVWRRTNRRPCCSPMSNPLTSLWTARPDGAGRWDYRMAAQHLPRGQVRPNSGQKNWLNGRRRSLSLETFRLSFFMTLQLVNNAALLGLCVVILKSGDIADCFFCLSTIFIFQMSSELRFMTWNMRNSNWTLICISMVFSCEIQASESWSGQLMKTSIG